MMVPTRTCSSCGTKKPKDLLYRFVWLNEMVEPDPRQIKPGRGAYCCKDEPCFRLLLDRKKKWKRLFRL